MRVKRGVTARARHNKIRKATKGMTLSNRSSVRRGQQAVIKAMEKQAQEFRQNKLNKLIGDILVEQGIITEEQRDQIINEQFLLDNSLMEKYINRDESGIELSNFEKDFLKTKWLDERFAKAVLNKGYAKKEDLVRAFHLQKSIYKEEMTIKLVGEIPAHLPPLSSP